MTDVTTLLNEEIDRLPDDYQTTITSRIKSIEQLINDQLGNRFQLQGELGIGGMGQVFKANDLELDRVVAIKAIHPSLIQNKEISERLRNEAKIVAKLKHANIVQIYDIIELSGHYLMVLEYIEGFDFKKIINQGTLTREEILKKFVTVCDAVQYAHTQGIIHQDLKPHNIMLTNEGHVKIMDFGISSLVDSQEKQESKNISTLEGSPIFMAPELYENNNANTITDVFALGVSLFYSQTKVPPFSGMSRETLIWNIINTDIPLPSSKYDKVSKEIDAICMKACARNPDDRYKSALEMGNDLRRLHQNLPVTARSYSLLESTIKGITFRPVMSVISFLTISILFSAVYLGSDHVHKIAENTLIDTLHHKVGSTAYNASIALDRKALVNLIDASEINDRLMNEVDQPLAALQRYNKEIRDFYILSPVNNNKDFKVVFARHGDGKLNFEKILKGHDTWSANPIVENEVTKNLLHQTMDRKLMIQEEQDADSTHTRSWQKRMLGFSPVDDSQGKPFAILVVEVSSGGIAEAYQQIEDAFQLALWLAVLMTLLFFIGVMMTLILLWKNTPPQQ